MTKKRVEFNREDNKTVNGNDNVEVGVDTSLMKALKYQALSVNYWGEGPSDDELSLGYDY